MFSLPIVSGHAIPILSLLIVTPMLAALAIRAMDDAPRARTMGLFVSAFALALSLLALAVFDRHATGFQLVETGFAVPGLPIRFRLGVDGLSLLAIPMVALVTLGVLLVTPTLALGPRRIAATLLLAGSTFGVLSAIDLGAFVVFTAIALVPMSQRFHLTRNERQGSLGLSRVFLGHQLLGFVALVTAVVMLLGAAPGGGARLDLAQLAHAGVPSAVQGTIFFLLLASALIRSGTFPFHTFLPLTLTAGSFPVGVVFATAPIGVYTLARIALPLLPSAVERYADVITAIALATILYGALLALVQRDLRRTVAYILISQTGLTFLGIAAHNVQGLAGAMLESLGIGTAAAGVLLVTVALEGRIGTATTRELAGLGKSMPRMAVFFFVFGFAAVGFPGSLAFVGEDLLMHGMFEIHPVIAAVALLGPALNGFTFLRAFGRTFLGRGQYGLESPPGSLTDLIPRERWGVVVLAAACLFAGLVPAPLIAMQHAAVHAMHPSDE